MTDQELLAYLKERIDQIDDIASTPFKLTGKFAHIATLSQECLDAIDEHQGVGSERAQSPA
jgi:hypothetical protein